MKGKNAPPAVIELRMKPELARRFEHETRACSSVLCMQQNQSSI